MKIFFFEYYRKIIEDNMSSKQINFQKHLNNY